MSLILNSISQPIARLHLGHMTITINFEEEEGGHGIMELKIQCLQPNFKHLNMLYIHKIGIYVMPSSFKELEILIHTEIFHD